MYELPSRLDLLQSILPLEDSRQALNLTIFLVQAPAWVRLLRVVQSYI